MKIVEKKSKTPNSTKISIFDGVAPIIQAQILLIGENNTYFESATNEDGYCRFKDLKIKPYSIYIAHPSYPGHIVEGYIPNKDLIISIEKNDKWGSIICPNGTCYIPGLEGRLNPILDTSNRTYLYADNISINGGQKQPTTFKIGEQMILEDRNGAVVKIVFLKIRERSSLFQYKKINLDQSEKNVSGLIIEAGGNIINSGEILANKNQFIALRSAKNIEHSGKIRFSDNPHKPNWVERITNNQTAAIVIGGFVLLILLYILFRYTGVNLSNYR